MIHYLSVSWDLTSYNFSLCCSPCSGPSIVTEEDRHNGVGGGDGDGPPDDGSGPSPHRPQSSVMKKTAQQVAGEALIGRLVEEVDGSCFSFR